jgi:site-specific DNA-adenine methylase
MKIKAIAPWYGSKRTLAPRIINQLGPHTTYVEPPALVGGELFAEATQGAPPR